MRQQYSIATRPGDQYVYEALKLKRRREDYQARIVLENAIQKHEENPRLWHMLGKVLQYDRSKDDKTLECFKIAYLLDPSDKFCAMDYSSFLTKKGKYDEAEEILARKYNEEGPSNIILTTLGDHYQRRGMYEKASACFGYKSPNEPTDSRRQRRYEEIAEKYNMPYKQEYWAAFEVRIKEKLTDMPLQNTQAKQAILAFGM